MKLSQLKAGYCIEVESYENDDDNCQLTWVSGLDKKEASTYILLLEPFNESYHSGGVGNASCEEDFEQALANYSEYLKNHPELIEFGKTLAKEPDEDIVRNLLYHVIYKFELSSEYFFTRYTSTNSIYKIDDSIKTSIMRIG